MLALEKVLSSILMPPGLFWLMWLIVTIYIFKKSKSIIIYIILLANLIFMYMLFTAIGTSLLVVSLEDMYLSINNGDLNHKYPIVVLGGGINYSEDRAYLSPYSLQRIVKGYEIYREIRTPILFTGGVAVDQKDISESEIAAEWLTGMGVTEEDIVIEDKARTTYENGIYVKKWLSGVDDANSQGNETVRFSNIETKDTVYLVTNALHLPRSVLVFKKQGINVIPVSSGIIIDHRSGWLGYLPNRNALTANMMALHEWLGLVWYKITGRI